MSDFKATIMALTDMGGVGPRTFQELLLRLGSPDNLERLSATDIEAIPRLGDGRRERIIQSLDYIGDYEKRLLDFESQGVEILTFFDNSYPASLREIGDPPPLIYSKGDLSLFGQKYIAIVGTTQATQSGMRLAVDLAREFVKRGYGIISGLAIGIDSAAHMGALKNDGITIAVLGCGIFSIYPDENTTLAESISHHGLLVSEYQPYRKVRAPQLILRNRLISALSRAVVVAQIGSQRRGELRTAQYALKQGKPLFFADPEGVLDSETIESNNALLITGTESVDEIIRYLI